MADVVGVYFGSHISRSAAELAYFMVLTLFPIFICLSAFVGQLHLDLAGLLEEAERFLPEGVTVILGDYLRYLQSNQSTGMFLAGVFMTVLFASAARAGADEHYARGLWPLHLPGSESAGGQYSLFLAPPVHDLPVPSGSGDGQLVF